MSTAPVDHEQLAFALPDAGPVPTPLPAEPSKPHHHGPAPLAFDQPVLRPVAFFVDLVLVAPARARDICVPPEKRKPKDFRYRRQREGRKPLSIGPGKLRGKERRELAVWDYQAAVIGVRRLRPKTLAECQPGPCPFASCKYNLLIDVSPESGMIKLNFPGSDVDDLSETCALRVANHYEEMRKQPPTAMVAKLLNLTDERLRQIEKGAIARLGPVVDPLAALVR